MYFPDEYHRLSRGSRLLIGSRSAVTCGTKHTYPERCERALPTSWLFVLLLTPTKDNAHVKSLPHTRMHMIVKTTCNIFLINTFWKLGNIRHQALGINQNPQSHDHASETWFMSFTLAEPTGTGFQGVVELLFSRSSKGGYHILLLSHCVHNSHILRMPLHNGMQGLSPIYTHKTSWKEKQSNNHWI